MTAHSSELVSDSKTSQFSAAEYTKMADDFFYQGKIGRAICYYRLALSGKDASQISVTYKEFQAIGAKLTELTQSTKSLGLSPEQFAIRVKKLAAFEAFHSELLFRKEQSSQPKNQEQILVAAREAYKLKDYLRAVELFDKYNWQSPRYTVNPQRVHAEYYKSLLHQKEYVKLYNQAQKFSLRGHPVDYSYWADACLALRSADYNAACLLEASGYYEQAIAAALPIIELLPEQGKTSLQQWLSHCYRKLGQVYLELSSLAAAPDATGLKTSAEYSALHDKSITNAVRLEDALRTTQLQSKLLKSKFAQSKTSPPGVKNPKLDFFEATQKKSLITPRLEKVAQSAIAALGLTGLPLFVFFALEGDEKTGDFLTKDLIKDLIDGQGIPVYGFMLFALAVIFVSLYLGLSADEPSEPRPVVAPAHN